MGDIERVENIVNGHVIVNVEAIEKSIKERVLNFGEEPVINLWNTRTAIYKASHSIQREYVYAFEPQMIAIGPFHQNKEALKSAEQLKLRYLRHLIERSPRKNTLQNYINLISEFREEARNYYSEPVEPNDNAFVEMMALDGCFLIEFLVKSYMGENLVHPDEVNWNLPLLRNDLLLLENQFPFPVLELLFDLSHIPDLVGIKENGTRVSLMDLVVPFITMNNHKALPEALNIETVHHLLHVYHASILPIPNSEQDQPASCFGQAATKTIERMKTLACAPSLCLLHSFFYCKKHLMRNNDKHYRYKRAPRLIPTATRLRDSGVKFKEKEATSSFLDARFDKEVGIMKIPVLTIQEATMSQFLNLIAFEQCNPTSGTHFTSHALLMNNLIKTPEDVNILESNGIIVSRLGHNKEVVKFFHKLCKGAYMDFENHHHRQLFKDVTEYYNERKWRMEVIQKYLKNPWSTMSIILLILTLLQTYYSMYGYYHPRPSSP